MIKIKNDVIRHCERSEAIQSFFWIAASAFGLLAMTAKLQFAVEAQKLVGISLEGSVG